MIELKELINRTYDGKEAVSFEYVIKCKEATNDELEDVRVFFEKREGDCPVWWDVHVLLKPEDNEPQVINLAFSLPVKNQDLTMVCATGLFLLQNIMKEKIQYYSMLDFMIGDIVQGM